MILSTLANLAPIYKFSIIFVLFFCLSACHEDKLGLDSDRDGLSDQQELLFGTDPYSADSNGDTIEDSLDLEPWAEAGARIEFKLVEQLRSKEKVESRIFLSLKNKGAQLLSNKEISLETSFGDITALNEINPGVYAFSHIARESGSANLRASFRGSYPNAPEVSEDFFLEFSLLSSPDNPIDPANPDTPKLSLPGINPPPYESEGSMNGELTIMSIDETCLDWGDSPIKAFKGAYVQIDFPSGESIFTQTNDEGWIRIEDPRLNEAVTVTVGAKGYRYMSFVNVNSRYLSFGMSKRDALRDDTQSNSSVSGKVLGFKGEGGLNPFPKENVNIFKTINIAIVQVATRNYPLSSMNTGSILVPPASSTPLSDYLSIPPNLVIANLSNPDQSRFSLPNLKPGKHLLFALAGEASRVFEATKNPYQLSFIPRALAVKEIELSAGQNLETSLLLDIDLQEPQTHLVNLGNLPLDPITNTPLPNALLLPIIDTGKGFVFLNVNSSYNLPGFTNPTSVRFVDPEHPRFVDLGLKATPLIVALAGREPNKGFDLPGISTLIRYANASPQLTDMNQANAWAPLPSFHLPAPANSPENDAVGETIRDRKLSWEVDEATDLSILRINYMTSPAHNVILGTDIGASKSHILWELFVPKPTTSITIPTLSPQAPDYPVIVNYEPSKADERYQYDPETFELEINAYRMGPRPFDYRSSFLLSDVNLNASTVSQDSYLFRMTE